MPKASRAGAILLGIGLVVAFLGPTAVGTASASIPPKQLCWVSGGSFEELATEEGVPLDVERSTIRIQVHENGTATFRVRNAINESAAVRLETDPDAREAVRDSVSHRVRTRNHDATVSAVHFEEDVVRITYSKREFASETGGDGLIVDRFAEHPHGYTTAADRVELRGPDGWDVANHPATGSVRPLEADGGEKVVWTGWQISGETYLVLAPKDGPLARIGAQLAVAGAVGPTMFAHAVLAGAPSSFVLAITLLACRGLPDPADDPVGPDSVKKRLKDRLLPVAIVLAPILLVLPVTPIGGLGPPLVAVELGAMTTVLAVIGVVFYRLEER